MKKNLSLMLLMLLGTIFMFAQVSPTPYANWDFNANHTHSWQGIGGITIIGGVTSTFTQGSNGNGGNTGRAFNTSHYPIQSTFHQQAGIQINISTAGYENIQISWENRQSATAANRQRLQYTIDGEVWIDFEASSSNATNIHLPGTSVPFDNGLYTTDAANIWLRRTADFSGLTAVEDQPNFAIRFVTAYPFGTSNYVGLGTAGKYAYNGTVRFDNIIISGVLTATDHVVTPTIFPPTGTYFNEVEVNIYTATIEADIYYTTDGTPPTAGSPSILYTEPFFVTANPTTIKAIAVKMELFDSNEATPAVYEIKPKVATPTITPPEGSYYEGVLITLECATEGATIRYTTNNTEPLPSSTAYTAPFPINTSQIIRAKAFKTDIEPSDEIIGPDGETEGISYTIIPKVATPIISPSEGVYFDAVEVTISTTTPSATIYYTDDNTAPTTSSPIYTTPFTITTSATIRAIANRSSFEDSEEAEAVSYVIIPSIPVYDGNGTFERIKVDANITEGYYLIIGAINPLTPNSTTLTAAIPYSKAITNTAQNGTFDGLSASFWAGANIDIMSDLITDPAGAVVWYFAGDNTTGFTIRNAQNNHYVDFTATTNGYATFNGVVPTDSGKFTFAHNTSIGTTSNEVFFSGENKHYTGRFLKFNYNTGNERYGNYASSMADLALFKLTSVASPIITPANRDFIDELTITMECLTPGATIFYTVDGSNPVPGYPAYEYAGPFTITTTSVVRALAYIDDLPPSVTVENNYTQIIPLNLESLQMLRHLPLSTIYRITGEVIVTHILTNRNQVYLQDSSGGILLDDPSPVHNTTPLSVGDGIVNLTGTLTSFQGMMQFIPYTNVKISSKNNTLVPDIRTFNQLHMWSDNYQGKLVTIKNVQFSTPSGTFTNNTLYELTDPTGNYFFVPNFNNTDLTNVTGELIPSSTFSLTGLISSRNLPSTPYTYITPRNMDDFYFIVSTPIFSPVEGVYNNEISVEIECTTPDATIYYTINGSIPTITDWEYTAPFSIDGYSIVRAIAVKTGLSNSEVAEISYFYKVATPVISSSGGGSSIVPESKIEITTETVGATIWYTIDGTTPVAAAPSLQYSSAFSLSSSSTVRAIATKTNYTTSEESTKTYTFTPRVDDPVISPPGGRILTTDLITISCATPSATIYYTTDGTLPTVGSFLYTSPFTISEDSTIRAFATKVGYVASYTTTESYTVSEFTLIQKQIVRWDFEGSVITPSVGAGTLSLVGGITTSFPEGSNGEGGNAGTSLSTTNYPSEFLNPETAGLQLNFSTVGFEEIRIQWHDYASNTAANRIQLQYSLDGISFSSIGFIGKANRILSIGDNEGLDNGMYITNSGATWYVRNADFSAITGANNNPNFALRLVTAFPSDGDRYVAVNSPSNTYATTGTIRYDNIVVYGFVPETTVATPIITPSPLTYPATHSYYEKQTVKIASETADAIIYYTIDDTVPTTSSFTMANGDTFDISATTGSGILNFIVRAIAVKPGLDDSAEATPVSYKIIPQVGPPNILPLPGAYISPILVSIAPELPGADIYYTLDGSTPSSTSALYHSPFTISSNTTVKAIAMKANLYDSEVMTRKYDFVSGDYELVTNLADIEEGYYVIMGSATTGISYRAMSSTPGQAYLIAKPAIPASSTITDPGLDTIWRFEKSGSQYSIYSVDEHFYVEGHISSATVVKAPSKTINSLWTITDSEQSAGGQKIFRFAYGSQTSRLLQFNNADSRYATYANTMRDITLFKLHVEKTATPEFIFSPAPHYGPVGVNLHSDTYPTNIYYTLDGTDPDETSFYYDSTIIIYTSLTLKARAFSSSLPPSEIASHTFNILYRGSFSPINDLADLDEGNYVLLGSNGATTVNNAMSNTYSPAGFRFEISPVDLVNNAIVDPNTDIVWKLTKYETEYVLFNQSANLYAGISSAGVAIFDSSISNYTKWNITASAQGSGNQFFKFANVGIPSSLQYYNTAPIRFAASTNLQNDLALYKFSTPNPIVSPVSGTYSDEVEVSMSCPDGTATIRYTLDGSEPLETSAAYTAPFTITTKTTVKARAFAAGMPPSSIITNEYRIKGITDGIFTRITDLSELTTDYYVVLSSSAVNNTSTNPNALVQPYAMTGEFNTVDRNLKSTLVTFNNEQIESPYNDIVWYIEKNAQGDVSFCNDLLGKYIIGTPSNNYITFSDSNDNDNNLWTVTISPHGANGGEDNIFFRFTTVSSATGATGRMLKSNAGNTPPIYAWYLGTVNNLADLALYKREPQVVATPVISPPTDEYSHPIVIKISTSTPGAEIYYTVHGLGSDPESDLAGRKLYEGPFLIDGSQGSFISARAYAPGMQMSELARESYTFNFPTPKVVFNPDLDGPENVYNSTDPFALELTCSLDTDDQPLEYGVTIYYTLQGDIPVNPVDAIPPETNFLYNAANKPQITNNTIVKARAFGNWYKPSAVETKDYRFATTAPVITTETLPPYSTPLEITISCLDSAAAVYYTTDGSTPLIDSSYLYTAPFVIDTMGVTKVSAIALAPDFAVSSLTEESFSIVFPVAGTPSITQSGGYDEFNIPTITITSATSGAIIYYTIDDTTPTTSSLQHTNGDPIYFDHDGNCNVKAIAVKEFYQDSAVATQAISFDFPTTPGLVVFDPDNELEIHNQPFDLTLSCPDLPGAHIYYTFNGSEPDRNDELNTYFYSIPFAVTESSTIKARAYYMFFKPSTTVAVTYTFGLETVATPVISPASGNYNAHQTVSISCTTVGAEIYYTLDGSTPNETSPAYTEPFILDTSLTVKAIACKTGYNDSAEAEAVYVINLPTLAEVIFNPSLDGEMQPYLSHEPFALELTCPLDTNDLPVTETVSIYYTLNGSSPTNIISATNLLYNSTTKPQITNNTVVKAQAYADYYVPSVVSSKDYRFITPSPVISTTAIEPYTTPIFITISCSDTNADIYYSLDGTMPLLDSYYLYNGSFTIENNGTTKVIAVAKTPDYTPSSSVEKIYSLEFPQLDPPQISPASGTYSIAQNISISHATADSILYAINSTDPLDYIKYEGPFALSINATIRSIAYQQYHVPSDPAVNTYSFNIPVVDNPVFSKESGTYHATIIVEISTTTDDAQIYYTTDGVTEPDATSTLYTSPLEINNTTTLKAKAIKTGWIDSATITKIYTIDPQKTPEPVFTPLAGSYEEEVEISLVCLDPSAKIYYTLDESDPTTSGTHILYQTTLTITETTVIKAVAKAEDWMFSDVVTAEYLIVPVGKTPGQFYQITNVAELETGYYIILGTSAGNATTPQPGATIRDFAMLNVQSTTSTTYMTQQDVTRNGDQIVNPTQDIIWFIERIGDVCTIYNEMAGKYVLGRASGTNGTSFGDLGANNAGYWTVSPSIHGGGNQYFRFSNNEYSAGTPPQPRALQYGNNDRFATYDRTQPDLALFKMHTIGAVATPVITPDAGTFSSPQLITISTTTLDADIYYTTDGSNPNLNSTKYIAPFLHSMSGTIKAIAYAEGYMPSVIAEATLTFTILQVESLVFSHMGGVYDTAQTITISTPTSGATIYYTLDGSTPSELSDEYVTPITISTTTTLKAIAYKDDYNPSPIATHVYQIITTIPVATLSELRSITGITSTPSEEIYKVTGEVIVTHILNNRNQRYIQDSTGGILVDQNPIVMNNLEIGDGLLNIMGRLSIFQDMLQFTPVSDVIANSTANPIIPLEVTFSELVANPSRYQATLVKVMNVLFDSPSGNFDQNVVYRLFDPTENYYFIVNFNNTDLTEVINTPIPNVRKNITGLVSSRAISAVNYSYLTARNLFDFEDYSDPTLYPPQNLQAQVNLNNVELSWQAPVSGSPTGYHVYRTNNVITYNWQKITSIPLQVSTLTYLDENLPSGEYGYYVSAVYTIGESGPSNIEDVQIGSIKTPGQFYQITSVTELETGSYIILGTSAGNATTPQPGAIIRDFAMLNVQNPTGTTYMTQQAVSRNEDQIVNPTQDIIWYIERVGDVCTIYNEVAGKYVLGRATGTNGTSFDALGTNNAGYWTVSQSIHGGGNQYFRFSNNEYNAGTPPQPRALQYGNNDRFATYDRTQPDLALFKMHTIGAVATPIITPNSGNFSIPQQITITTTTADADIYYTTDGSTPYKGSLKYTVPFMHSLSGTIKAIAYAEYYSPSPIAEATLTFDIPQIEMLVLTPPSGIYELPQMITITTETPDVNIYYTLDGSEPNETSTLYTVPFPINDVAVTSVRARAYKDNYSPSNIITNNYTFISPISVATLAELRAITGLTSTPSLEVYKVTGEVIVTHILNNRNQRYVQDDTGGILIDQSPIVITDLEVGDGLVNIIGRLSIFSEMLQFTPIINVLPNSQNNLLVPMEVTFAELTANPARYQATLVKVHQVFFTNPTENFTYNQIYVMSDQTDNYNFVSDFNNTDRTDVTGTPIPTTMQNITGIISSRTISSVNYTYLTARNILDIEDTPQVATPIITQSGGDLTNPPLVTITSSTIDAVVYYTIDGEIPTISSAQAENGVPFMMAIQGSFTVKALAIKQNMQNSEIATQLITFNLPQIAPPVILPEDDSIMYSVEYLDVEISATIGADIYYTTNGDIPSQDSAIYTTPIRIEGSTQIQAQAYFPSSHPNSYYQPSDIALKNYQFNLPTASAPTITTTALAPYHSPIPIFMATSTPNGIIHYTLDNTTPDMNSTLYMGEIMLDADGITTIKAIAWAEGFNTSAIAEETFILDFPLFTTPTIMPPAGDYTTIQTITITCPSADSIKYQIDNEPYTLYNGSFTLNKNTTVRAIAYKQYFKPSTTAENIYYIDTKEAGKYYRLTDIHDLVPGYYVIAGAVRDPIDNSSPASAANAYVRPYAMADYEQQAGYTPWVWVTAGITIQPDDSLEDPLNQYLADKIVWYISGDNTYGYTIQNVVTGKYVGFSGTNNNNNQYLPIPGDNELFRFSTSVHGSLINQPFFLAFNTGVSTVVVPENNTATRVLRYNYNSGDERYSNYGGSSGGPTGDLALFKMHTIGITTAPTISPNGGFFTTSTLVSINTTSPNASIFYSLDGSTPGRHSIIYTAPFELNASCVVKAIAFADHYLPSPIETTTFTFEIPQVATPVINPPTGAYNEEQHIIISTITEGASIYYTLDGTEPTSDSEEFTVPIPLFTTTTIKARAFKQGLLPSNIAENTYTFVSFTNVENIAELRTKEPDNTTIYRLASEVFVTYLLNNRNQKYVQDTTGGVMIDDPNPTIISTPLAVGDGILYLTGRINIYQGMLQFVPVANVSVNSTENSISPQEVTFAQLTANPSQYQATLVKVSNTHFTNPVGSIANNLFYDLTDTSNDYSFVANFNNTDVTNVTGQPIPVSTFTITGLISSRTISSVTKDYITARSYDDFAFNTAQPVANPVFTPLGGSYLESVTVALSCVTPDAEIRYTLDETEPSEASSLYSVPLFISNTTTIKAKAYKEDFLPSNTVTQTYTITEKQAGKFYRVTQINDVIPGQYIILNSTAVTTSAITGTNAMNNSHTTVTGNGYFNYTDITNLISGNEISHPEATIIWELSVNSEDQWTLYNALANKYVAGPTGTTNNNTQFMESQESDLTKWLLSNSTQGSTSGHVFFRFSTLLNNYGFAGNQARNLQYNINNGQNRYATYTGTMADLALFKMHTLGAVATPVISPNGGHFSVPQLVTMTCSTPEAEIYYTTDGSTPNRESTRYLAPFTFGLSRTIKAIAFAEFYQPSTIVEATFIFDIPEVVIPVITPPTGIYMDAQTVSINTPTPDALIYYTLNNTDPDLSSTLYTGSFTVSQTITVKAKAYKDGFTPSETATNNYVLPVEIANLAELRAIPTPTDVLYKLTGEVFVSYKQTFRNQIYLQDETAGILIDDNDGIISHDYNIGDGITRIIGRLNVNNGMLQFQPFIDTNPASSTGNILTPISVTLAQLLADTLGQYQARLVRVDDVYFTSTGNFASGQSYDLSDGVNTFVFYTNFYEADYIGTLIPNDVLDITGLVSTRLAAPNSFSYLTARSSTDFLELFIDYPPQNLQAQVNGNNVTLTWEAPEMGDTLGYNVYRTMNIDVPDWQKLTPTPLPTTATVYLDSGLPQGEYWYHVTALFASNESPQSNIVQVSITNSNNDITGPITKTELIGNYPNPFNPETTIRFNLLKSDNVLLEVYNIKGQKVKTLVNKQLSNGHHQVVWNGKDEQNVLISSGIYFIRMSTSEHTEQKRMILLK